ncbi:MAG: translation initiation factor IF-2 associated domain-containing protein, partial [Hyphomicrobiaceae bacterium]
MTETKDSGDKTIRGGGRKPLSLARTVESGHVRQNFSHGRSKSVVVEKRKTRKLHTPGAEAEKRAASPDVAEKPAAAPAPASKGKGKASLAKEAPAAAKTLSSEELDARARALAAARARAVEEQQVEAEQHTVAVELEKTPEPAPEAHPEPVTAKAATAASEPGPAPTTPQDEKPAAERAKEPHVAPKAELRTDAP